MKKGFTLIEVISVISIIGLLLTLVAPSVNRIIVNNQNKTYLLSSKNIYNFINNYTIDNNIKLPISYVYDGYNIYYNNLSIVTSQALKDSTGIIEIDSNGSIKLKITNGKICATNYDSDEIVIDECDIEEEIYMILTKHIYDVAYSNDITKTYTFSSGKLQSDDLDITFKHSYLFNATGKIENGIIYMLYNDTCVTNDNGFKIVSKDTCI